MSVDTENSSEAVSLETMLASALGDAAPESADPSPETVSTAEETGALVSTETVAEADPVALDAQTIEPPAEMSAEQRTAFKALPVEAQRQLAERYADVRRTLTQKTEEIAKERTKYSELESAFEPYREQLALQGTTPAAAASRLLAAQNVLTRNPVEGLKWLSQSLGVDLRSLVPPPEKDEEYLSPDVKALKDEIRELRGQIQQQHVGQQNAQQAEAQRILTEFRSAKDDKGEPKHPHADHPEVKAVMGSLIGRGKTLEQAYAEAVYVLPEVRSRIAEEAAKAARAEVERKAEEARKTKLSAARTASQTIRSRGVADEKPASGSIEDDLRAAMREVS
jgi:hypothetical protein